MRTQLISLFLIASVVCGASELPKTINIILTASKESQIREWASHQGTASRLFKFKGDGKDVIVLLLDIASGLTRENIFVFYWEQDEWHLCLVRPTNGQVEVKSSGHALIFRNSKGTVLVEQPFASMRHAEGEK